MGLGGIMGRVRLDMIQSCVDSAQNWSDQVITGLIRWDHRWNQVGSRWILSDHGSDHVGLGRVMGRIWLDLIRSRVGSAQDSSDQVGSRWTRSDHWSDHVGFNLIKFWINSGFWGGSGWICSDHVLDHLK